jgi:hypothetical protein
MEFDSGERDFISKVLFLVWNYTLQLKTTTAALGWDRIGNSLQVLHYLGFNFAWRNNVNVWSHIT